MRLKIFICLAFCLFVYTGIALALSPQPVSAKYESDAKTDLLTLQNNQCSRNACAVHCLLNTYFTGWQGFEPYIRWYDTAYELTGCTTSELRQSVELLLAIAAEIVGAPGAYTLSCDEMMNLQAHECYTRRCTNPCTFAPDLDIDLTCDAAGNIYAVFSNDFPANAYTMLINNFLSIQRENGTAYRVFNIPQNLAYENWITTGGLPECVSSGGGLPRGCELVLPFQMPTWDTWSTADTDGFNWQGGLVDLSWFVTVDDGHVDSDLSQGIAVLKHDGDEIHIEAGAALQGIVLTVKHSYETDRTTYEVSRWQTSGNNVVRFSVDECAEWHPCDAIEEARDVDKYIIATSGQPYFVLPGTYTLKLESSLTHDKQISDNSATCSYEKTPEVPPLTPPGYYHRDNLWYPVDVYRVNVPPGSTFLGIYLDGMSGKADFDLYVQYGQMPGRSAYLCRPYDSGPGSEACVFNNPQPGDYYIVVDRFRNNGAYDLGITILPHPVTATPTRTPTASRTPTRTATRTPTPVPTATQCIVSYQVKVYSHYGEYSSTPLEGAKVMMQIYGSNAIIDLGRTNAQGYRSGSYLIPPDSMYRLGVQKDGYIFSYDSADGSYFTDYYIPYCQPANMIFTALATPTRTPTLSPTATPHYNRITISGRTTYGDLTTIIPYADVNIDVYNPTYHTTPTPVGRTRSRSDGTYYIEIYIPDNSTLTLWAEKPGFTFLPSPSIQTLTSGDQTLTVNFYTNTTPTPTPTRTLTPTPTISGTPTNTRTPRPTRTPTPTITLTGTRTPTPTRTITPTRTASKTRTLTITRTGTVTILPTRTPTRARTATNTRTLTPTLTATRRPSKTPTPVITRNNFWGWVTFNGEGLADVRILMEVNRSGIVQHIATTDADGNYKVYVDLPADSSVRLWAEKSGFTFTPSSYQWTQPSVSEDRRMDFTAAAQSR